MMHIALKGGSLRFLFVGGLLITLLNPLWARNGRQIEMKMDRISIPAPTIYEVQRGLSPRQRVLVQKGQPGLRVVAYTLHKQDGKTVRKVISDLLIKPPQPTVYRVGIVGSLTSRGGFRTRNSFVSRKVLTMHATAYDPYNCGGSGTGRTAMGIPAGYGKVAVDPKVIPLGTLLYVEGYGMAIAADRGSAIKGNRIDLGYHSYRQALQFGRRKVKVHVLN